MANKVIAKGIDLSKHNGAVNFTQIKTAGYSYVILRAGLGRLASQKDPMFESYYKAAKAAGLNVGAYWYSYANSVDDAELEAKACLECIKGKQFEYPIYFDVEEASQFKMGKNTVSAMIKKFLGVLEQNGYWVGLYMSASPLVTYTTDDIRNRYAIWVAQYAKSCTYKGTYGMWQYGVAGDAKWDTRGIGKVPGVSGSCDVDECFFDYPTAIKQKGLNGYPKQPTVPYAPEGDIKRNDTGDKVKWLQEKLTRAGYFKTAVNGNFDKVTLGALLGYQFDNGLTLTGVCDTNTKNKLRYL